MKIRLAEPNELDTVYSMGYDVWSDGLNLQTYLELCRGLPKYKKGQWWVLADSNQKLLSSLIVYPLTNSSAGIGSIATPVSLRKKGFATTLLKLVCTELELNFEIDSIFLFADIGPEFYKKQSFVELPPEFQRYKSTTCMVRSRDPQNLFGRSGFSSPDYF